MDKKAVEDSGDDYRRMIDESDVMLYLKNRKSKYEMVSDVGDIQRFVEDFYTNWGNPRTRMYTHLMVIKGLEDAGMIRRKTRSAQTI